MEESCKPAWWPKNPYGTNKEWYQKSVNEQVWEEASDDILKAYNEYIASIFDGSMPKIVK